MSTENKKIISLWVDEETEKQFKLASGSQQLQKNIVDNFIRREVSFIEEEMREIDEMNTKYYAKLLKIKDNFAESNDKYMQEVDRIYVDASAKFSKFDNLVKSLSSDVERVYEQVNKLSTKLEYVNPDRLERLLDAVERFKKMSKDEQDLIKLIIEKQ